MEYWITVVDDDTLCLTNARNILSAEDMKVSCLKSGQALLKYMENHEPDLILMDIMMPDMDGFETFHTLRKMEEQMGRIPTPVIFLTGENDDETERRGLTLGASDFIRKPFNHEILISRIKNTVINSRTIESLTEEATLDKLTGFLNKNSGTKRITTMCAESDGALLVIDLDSFKLVNDLYGHDMGDRVLEAFADVIRNNTGNGDVASRIGGDEFMAFFTAMDSEEAVASLCKRLNEQLFDRCISLMGENFGIPIGVSIGAVFVPEHGTEYQTLFRYADGSLYRVKQNGKHGYAIYNPSTDNMDEGEADLDKEMKRVTTLMEERGGARKAMIQGQDDFTSNYRFLVRMVASYGIKAYKLLFLVSPVEKGTDISEAVRAFSNILQDALDTDDIIFQNRPDQFLVLMVLKEDQNAADVADRVLSSWEACAERSAANVTYISEQIL